MREGRDEEAVIHMKSKENVKCGGRKSCSAYASLAGRGSEPE